MSLRLRLVPLSGLDQGQPVILVVEQADHTAERPSWDCRACDKPWPCDPAREALASEMDRVQLAVFMWTNLDEAVRDMPTGLPSELFERFIRWTH